MSKKHKYLKESSRILVKFINGETNELLFEITNRTSIDVGEVFSDHFITEISKLKGISCDCIRVLAVGDFFRE